MLGGTLTAPPQAWNQARPGGGGEEDSERMTHLVLSLTFLITRPDSWEALELGIIDIPEIF